MMAPMHRRRPLLVSLLAGALAVSACGTPADPPAGSPAAPPTAEPAQTTEPTAPPAPAESAAPTDPAPAATPVLDQPWATATLTDVSTGEPFRIADFAGTTVIIEPMAIWCTNCRAQQRDVQAAFDELGPDAFRYVVLDVDPNETADALADYQARNEFRGTYAVVERDVARALAAEFGDQVLNPPSTPMIVIGTDGRVTFAEFGHKSVARVVELARDHGA
jgi:thiol-disulfide isomerase/thioredoxin